MLPVQLYGLHLFRQRDIIYSRRLLLTILETALSICWYVNAAWNAAVILVLTAISDCQSRVINLSVIALVSFGAVVSVPLGLTAAAHRVSLRFACWWLLMIRL